MVDRFDLTALRARLPRGKGYAQLNDAIRRSEAIQSLKIDLEQIIESIAVLSAHVEGHSHPFQTEIPARTAAIERALATHAIIVYARCTDGTAKARANIDVRRLYSVEQLQRHRELIHLRNDAIAHFGMGDHDHGPWNEELLALEEVTIAGSIHRAVRINFVRANYRGWSIQAMREFLPILQQHASREQERRDNHLLGMIATLDPQTDAMLRDLALPDGPPQVARRHRRTPPGERMTKNPD